MYDDCYNDYVKYFINKCKPINIYCTGVLNHSLPSTKYIHPKEINSLFTELRGLTEEVKVYYAYHAVLIIIESVMILVSTVTTLTVNLLNELDTDIVRNGYFMGHCFLRFLFLFFVVRETHTTSLEVSII